MMSFDERAVPGYAMGQIGGYKPDKYANANSTMFATEVDRRCIRDRLHEAGSSADRIAIGLGDLLDMIEPASGKDKLGGAITPTTADPRTLSDSVDDLLSTISLIEQRLNRLSSAITG